MHQLPARGDLYKVLSDWSRTCRKSKSHTPRHPSNVIVVADSPIISWRIFGQRYIALSDYKSACDLLEARASIYSDRPVKWMWGHLVSRGGSLFHMSSQNPRFKAYRRVLQGSLNPRALSRYQETQEDEMRILLKSLASAPENFVAHFRRYVPTAVHILHPLKITAATPVQLF